MKAIKKTFIVLMVLLVLAIPAVSAEDTGNMDTTAIGLSEAIVDNAEVSLDSYQDTKSSSTVNSGSYSDLSSAISSAAAGDEIILGSNITKTSSDSVITIDKDITIDGSGYTIDADSNGQIFNINNNAHVVLTNIVLTGGSTGMFDSGGAAIEMEQGSLTLSDNVSFISNVASSSFGGNGGAIYGSGDVTISGENVVFKDNSASGNGGAIYLSNGDLTVSGEASFINNSANNAFGSYGGAIYLFDNLQISGSASFVGNVADRGSAISGSSININGSRVIFKDHAGYSSIYASSSSGSVNVTNAVFSNNSVISISGEANFNGNYWGVNDNPYNNGLISQDIVDEWAVPVIDEDSIIVDGEGYQGVVSLNQTNLGNNFNCSKLSEIKLKLNINGKEQEVNLVDGYSTFNFVLDEGNTANIEVYDYETNNLLNEFEVVCPSTIPDGTFADLDNLINSNENDYITLDTNYSYNPDEDQEFQNGIVINRNLTIDGAGHIINASSIGRIFHINNGANLVLTNIILADGALSGFSSGGAAIYVEYGSLTLSDNVSLVGNNATAFFGSENGGAIYSFNGDVTISGENVTFRDNVASGNGGAIYITNGDLIISGEASFINNTALNSFGSRGGAIYVLDDMKVNGSASFVNNSADRGGAIHINGYLDLNGSDISFINNSASENGGAIDMDDGFITNVDFINNTAGEFGSAVYNEGAIEIKNALFINNTASFGDVIYSNNNLVLSNNIFINNNSNASTLIYHNKGNLNLSNNTMISDKIIKIYNNGTVISQAYLLIGNYSIVFGDSVILKVNITDDEGNIIVGQNVTLGIDGLGNYTLEPADNGYSIIITPETTGSFVVTGNYNGSSNLTIHNGTINIAKADSIINVGIEDDIIAYEEFNITVSVSSTSSEKVEGTVHVIVKDNNDDVVFEYYSEITDETLSITVFGLDAGDYTVDAVFKSSKFNTTSYNGEFSVNSRYVLVADDLIIYYKNGTQFAVQLTHEGLPATGENVTISINGVNYTRTVGEDGFAYISINLNPGEYNIAVYYGNLTVNSTVTVLSTVVGEDLVKYYKNDSQYIVQILDGQGNPVANTNISININGVFYYRTTDSEGNAMLNINLNPGEYILTVENRNNGQLYSNVVTVLPTVVVEDLVKYYKNESQYVINVVDSQGHPVAGKNVSININGVFYYKTTDAEGSATLNINLNPGTYIATVQDLSNGLMMSSKVTVLPTITGEDLVMTYGDGSSYEVEVVDSQGNPLADETVTFNINGVFYNRTTDAGGIARLNINLNPGDYIVTAYHGDAAISNTVTVRP